MSDAALLWALSRDLGLDGFRVQPAALTEAYAKACKASEPIACEIQSGAVPRDSTGAMDVASLKARADEWCAGGDASACLVRGMLTIRQPFAGFRADASQEEQRDARVAFAKACDAGLPRGCTELGTSYLEETWSYPSEAWARINFQKACDAGEPEGCRQAGILVGPKQAADRKVLLERARSLGHVEAAADLGVLADDPTAIDKACSEGSTAACRAAGAPERSCAAGDPDGCLTQMLKTAAKTNADRVALTETLASMCSFSDRACREAEFLRDGSPILPSEPGHYASPGVVQRYLADQKDGLRLCHVRALKANPEAHGLLDVWMRIGVQGRVAGVYVVHPFDEGLADCADRVLKTIPFKAPLMGAALVHFTLPFDATTRVDVREIDNTPEGGALALLADELRARGDAMDACVVANDDPRFIREAAFHATVLRTGELTKIEWPSADFEPETKACLEDVLRAPISAAPMMPTRFEGTLSFLDEFQVPTWKIIVEPIQPVAPDHLRLLAVIPASSTVEGQKVTAEDAAARVEKVHARLAELVKGFTRGGLVVETEIRTVPIQVDGATLDIEDDELTRLRLEAFDLPDELWTTLPAGRFDGVVLWVPIPAGKTAATGTVVPATLRGAAFSAVPLSAEASRTPRVETLLHAVWAQYAARVQGQLGVTLPSPDQQLEVEGKVYDNEFWTLDPYRPPTLSGMRIGNQTGDVMPMYTYLFRKTLHPAMRADLIRLDLQDRPPDDDLALLGQPMRDGGARNVEVLTDGRRTMDPPEGKATFQDSSWLAADRSDDDLGWWGVAFASPVDVKRVRARFGDTAKGAPTVKTVVLEGRTPQGWVAMSKSVTLSQADLTVTLPAAVAFDAVRFRLLEKAGDTAPTCAEIEVYAK